MQFKEWKSRRVDSMPWWGFALYGFAAFLFGFNILHVVKEVGVSVRQIMWASEVTAAWAQAVGMVVAIGLTYWLAKRDAHQRDRALRRDALDRVERVLVIIDDFVLNTILPSSLDVADDALVPDALRELRAAARAIVELDQAILPTANLLSKWLMISSTARQLSVCYEELLSSSSSVQARSEAKRRIDLHMEVLERYRAHFAEAVNALSR